MEPKYNILTQSMFAFGNCSKLIAVDSISETQKIFEGYKVSQATEMLPSGPSTFLIFSNRNEQWHLRPNCIMFQVTGPSQEDVGAQLQKFMLFLGKMSIIYNRLSVTKSSAIYYDSGTSAEFDYSAIFVEPLADIRNSEEFLLRWNKRQRIHNETINCISSIERAFVQRISQGKLELYPALVLKTDVNTDAANVNARFKGDALLENMDLLFDKTKSLHASLNNIGRIIFNAQD